MNSLKNSGKYLSEFLSTCTCKKNIFNFNFNLKLWRVIVWIWRFELWIIIILLIDILWWNIIKLGGVGSKENAREGDCLELNSNQVRRFFYGYDYSIDTAASLYFISWYNLVKTCIVNIGTSNIIMTSCNTNFFISKLHAVTSFQDKQISKYQTSRSVKHFFLFYHFPFFPVNFQNYLKVDFY